MKRSPSVLMIAVVLLSTYIPPSTSRPRGSSFLDHHDDYKDQLNVVVLRAMSILSGGDSRGHALRNSPILPSADGSHELSGLTKRHDDPPISIDLTFHLLRNMIEMARIENQREQAELNRKYLDEVGK